MKNSKNEYSLGIRIPREAGVKLEAISAATEMPLAGLARLAVTRLIAQVEATGSLTLPVEPVTATAAPAPLPLAKVSAKADKQPLMESAMIRISREMRDNLEDLAAAHGISVADLIRAAVAEKLADWSTNGLHLKPSRKPRREFAKATA